MAARESSDAPGRLAIGRIVRAHGLKGEVAVEPLTPHLERFAAGETLWLGRSAEADDAKPVTVVSSRVHQGRPLLVLEGVADRTAAEHHVGLYVLVGQAVADAAVEEDEFYLHALIGRHVRTADGRPLGQVMDVMEVEESILLEIGAASAPRRLLPFVREFVREVGDDEIVITPPEGWEEL